MNKKELVLVDGGGNCLKWKWAGGGELPVALKGLYTSKREAEKAKEVWQNTKGRKYNGKSES